MSRLVLRHSLPLQCFLPWLQPVEVGSIADFGVSVTILLLWGNISLWEGVLVPKGNISLWEGVVVLEGEIFLTDFLSFLVTEATCLLHLATLLVHSTLTRPSQDAVAWLMRILASSLSTTQYLTGWNFLSLMFWVGTMIHPWACMTPPSYASNCARVGSSAVSLGKPSVLNRGTSTWNDSMVYSLSQSQGQPWLPWQIFCL